jgi:signal transduction histidine kinase
MPARPDDRLLRENLIALLRACDIVFGSTSMALSLFASWLCVIGSARLITVILLWAMPVINLIWSRWSPRHERWLWLADLVRVAISLPIVTVIYVADPGVLQRLWLPGLLLVVGVCLSLGIGTRQTRLGNLVACSYALAVVVTAALRSGTLDFMTARDATGVMIVGLVISLVASRLGRSLDDAQRQRVEVERQRNEAEHQRNEAHDQKERAERAVAQLEHRSRELSRALDDLHALIEQRARIEMELRQAQKLESVGRLAAGVAHEINTPVQFVSDSVQFVGAAVQDVFGLIDKLGVAQRSIVDGTPSRAAALEATEAADEADLPYLVEHVPKAIGHALEGLARVAAIVRALKVFAHPDATGMVAADLNQAIRSTLTIACHEYRYIAELETELGDLPLVWCHVGELNQAVLNIVVNAAHAIGDVVAGTDRKGRIRVRTHREGDDVVIAIADTGPGIPATVREHIFDPFFTTKEVGRGSGQGLAIARSVIVDKHGGQLALETEIGKGSTFFIRLPIHERPCAAPAG